MDNQILCMGQIDRNGGSLSLPTCAVCQWTSLAPPGHGEAPSPGTAGWSRTLSPAPPACGWCRTSACASPPSAPARCCSGDRNAKGHGNCWPAPPHHTPATCKHTNEALSPICHLAAYHMMFHRRQTADQPSVAMDKHMTYDIKAHRCPYCNSGRTAKSWTSQCLV